MTSVPQQAATPSQNPSSASQSIAPVQSPPPTSGTSSPQAAVPGRSFANAIKKTATSSAHGRADSISPAVPALSGPTIVNGNNAISSSSYQGDHSRKSSVTISASGTSGQMPNGGPVAGKPAAGNPIQFGQMSQMNANSNNSSPNIAHSAPNAQNSAPGLSTPSAQRVNSPSPSPSPIPQPAASGGRPPSSLHGQGPGLSFGAFGGGNANQPQPGMPPAGSLNPSMQSAHLRRDSSQSSHPEMNNGMGPNGGRGGYQQGGRGRGYNHGQQYQQPSMHSPNNSFRSVPNAPRGGQMGSPYMAGARPLAGPGFPNSPHQAARSPSLAATQPAHPPQGQMPMQTSQMPGYYNPHMQHQQQGQFMNQGYDYYAYQHQYGMQPGMQPGMMQPGMPQPGSMPMPAYTIPPSPRPQQYTPQGHQQYPPGQYGQPQPMSRTPSGVSERPSSTAGPSQSTSTPATSHQSSVSRSSNSPAPKTTFQIPSHRKSAAIIVKDPTTGAVKDFAKPGSSPAPSRSPANSNAAPTPPPQSKTPSQPEPQHSRTDSQVGKSSSEKAKDMQAAVRQKIKDDEERERLAKEKKEQEVKEPDLKKDVPVEENKESTSTVEVDKSEANVTEALPDPEKTTATPDTKSPEEPRPEQKTESEKEEKEVLAPEDNPECDEYWERIEAEEAKKEAEREAAYQKRKAVEDEEKKKKDAEEAARLDEEMKKAEREAEAAEEARLKKLEDGQEEDKEGIKLFAELKKSDNAFQATKTSSAAETPGESGAQTPVSDTSSTMGPPRAQGGKQNRPVPLKLETSKPVDPPQPSAALQSLRSARFLTSIGRETYPSSIQSPNPALNSAAPMGMGKFRYDKEFLLQFQKVFVEKPSETWSEKLKETVGDPSETPQSARPRNSGAMTSRQASNRGSILPSSGFGGSSFGQFGLPPGGRTLPPGTTSEQRFNASNAAAKGAPLRYNPQGFGAMNFTNPMSRSSSSTGGGQPGSPRPNQSRRGGDRGSRTKRDTDKDAKAMPLTQGLDIKPIHVSETGWKPTSIGKGAQPGPLPGGDTYLAPDVVQRKVKAALNKMTPSTFDKISSQILDIVSQSQKETDGRTLRQVIGLTFEKATDEAHWAAMYAEFCGRMLTAVQSMKPEICDETLPLDKNGKVNAGGTLFRKYLLNRCQQDFEAGWKSKLPEKPEGDTAEAAMLSDEYYAAAAAKRRGLGLVRFIGELYKLGMLTSRIMHMCVKRLVDFEGMPDEAEVESLTSLLKTIGGNLDSEEKARPSMDAYFERINTMINLEGLPSRLKFMLMDIVDLRKSGWKSREAVKGPTTIEEVRAQAAAAEREKEAQRQAESSRRGGGGGGRMPMGRGDARNFSGNSQMLAAQSNTVGMDDLRRLGKGGSRQASSQGTGTFGPPSMFNTRGSNQRKSLGPGILGRGGDDSAGSSRTGTPPAQREKKEEREAATSANAFSALAALDSGETNDNPASPPSSHASPSLAKARPATEQPRSKSPLKGEEKQG